MKRLDPIAVVEKGYEAHGGEHAWLTAIANEVLPHLGADWFGGLAFVVRASEAPEPPFAVVTPAAAQVDDALLVQMVLRTHGAMPEDHREDVGRMMQTPGVASILDIVPALPAGLSEGWPVQVMDSHGVFVPLGDGRTAVLANVCGRRSGIDSGDRTLWHRVAIHLGAGCRLAGRAASADAPDVEAVLEPGGKLLHATPDASDESAREALVHAVREVDRVRTAAGRADPDAALEIWRGLLAGRWSLVDHFESDGRRFVLARKNDPDAPAPRALSGRQRQVTFYASLGWSNTEIAYALGIAENTVSAHLHQSLKKLGLSRSELIRLAGEIVRVAPS
ncbi:MAG: helix-turn-helix transcriptional regulator [Myxococcales bacterium]|nr:helix-turn-helix transcriptional regulator [Myxococcales bacterium]MCB9580391.1 helix-turn-helix transcriptional regulator [Polyangiaceae bacterium]